MLDGARSWRPLHRLYGSHTLVSMTVLKMSHFVIEYTDPPSAERRFAMNRTLNVVCASADRALAMFREQSSDGVVHVIRRVGTDQPILVDLP